MEGGNSKLDNAASTLKRTVHHRTEGDAQSNIDSDLLTSCIGILPKQLSAFYECQIAIDLLLQREQVFVDFMPLEMIRNHK